MALAQQVNYTIDDIYALPDGQRAELIDGQMYMMSPPNTNHQRISYSFARKVSDYIDRKKGNCEVFLAPFAVFLNQDNVNYVEPDISIICDKQKLSDRGCEGAPDWIIEIVSPGNSSHDYIRKLNLYADAGAQEYWIVNPINHTVLVYHLEESKFEVSSYTFQDKIKVNIYDDLWINFQEVTL